MSDLTPEEARAVEAALAILERPEDHQPLTNRLMLACNMAYHERTAVYGYLAGDRDGYRRGVESAIHRCVDEGMLWMASELRALLDPAALAREALNLCSTGPQPGESTTIGECNQGTEWSSTCLRWRHIRNGEAVKDEQYDEDAPKGHSTEADFHIFARDNLATLARSVLALTEERDRMRGLLTEARDALTPLSEYELPIMLLNRIDAALRGKEKP